jgi:hypothetical protein
MQRDIIDDEPLRFWVSFAASVKRGLGLAMSCDLDPITYSGSAVLVPFFRKMLMKVEAQSDFSRPQPKNFDATQMCTLARTP